MNIKETVKTPSRALELMLEGLRDPNRPFKIDMGTFGDESSDPEYCFGCAATCASYKLLEIEGITFQVEAKDRWGIVRDEINSFEFAIDEARQGSLTRLFRFFDLDYPSELYQKTENRIHLWTHDWEQQAPAVESLIADLKAEGH